MDPSDSRIRQPSEYFGAETVDRRGEGQRSIVEAGTISEDDRLDLTKRGRELLKRLDLSSEAGD